MNILRRPSIEKSLARGFWQEGFVEFKYLDKNRCGWESLWEAED